MRKVNMILNTDSYKFSMFKQCPPGTEHVYSYIESRGGKWDKTVNFGIQAFLKEYLSTPITNAEIIQAKIVAEAHGVPFNHDGWDYVMRTHNGMFPVKIKAAPEGLVIPTHNVLATIVNTDPKCFWLTTYLETALLRGIWYPTTVATNSWACKQVILKYLEKTGDPASISFKLHDFGARGGSSYETVALGGMAHLVNFMGTDTVAGVLAASQYYDAPVSGFSIPAMEHSTVTSWGKEHEVDAYRNMLKCYAKNGSIVAAVSDSYDIYNACESL
jgi:nicotinamide phosphoribosyltransferase